MIMKRILKSLVILMLFSTSVMMNNQVIKADGTLSPGLYIYQGKGDPKDDDNLGNYSQSKNINFTTAFSIVYVDGTIENEKIKRVVISKENLVLGQGLTLRNASFDDQFLLASAESGGTYTIKYTVDENEYTVSITLPEKMAQGLYIYNGTISSKEDSDPANYIKTKQYGIKNNCRVMLIYVDENGTKNFVSPPEIQKDQKLEIHEAGNDYMMFYTETAGNYAINYNVSETVTYSVTLEFVEGPSPDEGDQDSSLATCVIDGVKYYFGFVDWSNKGDQTEKAFMVDYRPFNKSDVEMTIPSAFVGTKSQQANKEVASQAIMSSITDLTIELDSSSTINPQAVQIIKKNGNANVFGTNCEWYDLIIDFNYPGKAIFKISFNLHLGEETKQLTSYQEYEVIDYIINVIELSEEEMNNFDYHFNPDPNNVSKPKSAYDKLEALLSSREIRIDREFPQEIIIVLPQGSFYGMYHINMQDYIDADNRNTIKFVGKVDNGDYLTAINGGFVVNGGRVIFENLKMIGNVEITYNDNSERDYSQKKVAFIAEKTSNDQRFVADIPWVASCLISNYDYALVSTENGVIAACNNNYFEDNNYCFYMDCKGKWFSTGAEGNYGNVFVNSKIAAIALISTPSYKPFNVKFNKNLFFSNNENAYDFYVEEDGNESNKAIYLMMYNYYGKTLDENHNSVTRKNIRSARVNYGKTKNAIVYTNPCLMFPLEEPVEYINIDAYRGEEINSYDDPHVVNPYMEDGVLGLDDKPGLFSCASNDTKIVLNALAKETLTTFEIIQIGDDGVKRLGGLRND